MAKAQPIDTVQAEGSPEPKRPGHWRKHHGSGWPAPAACG